MTWDDLLIRFEYGCSKSDIESFERELGSSLPSSYVDFLLKYNGGKARFKNRVGVSNLGGTAVELSLLYPLNDQADEYGGGVAGLWRFWTQDGCNLKNYIPIGDDNGGAYFFLVFQGGFEGQVFYSYAEDFFRESVRTDIFIDSIPPSFSLAAKSFSEFPFHVKPCPDLWS